jgi:cobalt-zinc-cadmium efflux system outer membrane protein
MKRLALFAVVLSAWALLPAQETSVKLDDLVRTALDRNPGLKALAEEVEARKHSIAPAGALPDPVLALGVKNMSLDRWTVGVDVMSGIPLSLSQSLPFPGKQRLKSEVAVNEADRAGEDLRSARLSVTREVKELYARLYYYRTALDLVLEKEGILGQAVKDAEAKYAVGQGTQSDLFKAQVEISGVRETVLTMEGMIRTLTARLNSVLDLPPESPVGRLAPILLDAMPLGLDEIQTAADKNSPILRSASLMIDRGGLAVAMARKEFLPDFMVMAGKEFKGALPDMYQVSIGVEVPLYFKRKQAPLLAAAVSRLTESRASYASMKNDLQARLSEDYLAAKTAESLLKLYADKTLPQASLALESSLANYRVSKVDFLTLLSDINALIGARIEVVRNRTDLWAAAARIEELTGLEIMKQGAQR